MIDCVALYTKSLLTFPGPINIRPNSKYCSDGLFSFNSINITMPCLGLDISPVPSSSPLCQMIYFACSFIHYRCACSGPSSWLSFNLARFGRRPVAPKFLRLIRQNYFGYMLVLPTSQMLHRTISIIQHLQRYTHTQDMQYIDHWV